jgi:hypothetical protein
LVFSKVGRGLDVLESPLTNSIMIFPVGNVDDTITVMAYTATDDAVPSDTVLTTIKVKSDQPIPKPKIVVTPTPPAVTVEPEPTAHTVSKVHVTFYVDFNKKTRAISDVIDDQALRKWLIDAGHKVHELSVNDDLGVLGLADELKGKYAPQVIIQVLEGTDKEGTLLDIEPMSAVQQVKELVTKSLTK